MIRTSSSILRIELIAGETEREKKPRKSTISDLLLCQQNCYVGHREVRTIRAVTDHCCGLGPCANGFLSDDIGVRSVTLYFKRHLGFWNGARNCEYPSRAR